AFQHHDFRLYLASSLATNLGTQMLDVAVGWQIYATTHRAIDLGYVGLVQFIPALALSLVAGSVADHFNRARVVAIANFVLAACAVALLSLTLRGFTSVAPTYVVLFFVGVARVFDAPASQALVPSIVPAEHFPNAVTWSSTAWQTSTIVGPALGGLLYGVTHSAVPVYVTCAVALTIAGILCLIMRVGSEPKVAASPESEEVGWSKIVAGVRFVRTHPVILHSVSLDLLAVLLGGATALLPIYAHDILKVDAWGLGLLRSAPAVGAAAMAIALAYRPLVRNAGAIMLGAVGVFGAATIVFGISNYFPLSLFALMLLGASDMVSVVVRSTVVQLRTPDAMRGRVSAVSSMFIATSSDLGSLESGLTAAWLGAMPAVVIGGVGTLVVVALYAFGTRALRNIDRLDEPETPEMP
ncbi:MAG: MFS transporter, partial [Polyangiaceae bacterium]